MTDNTQDKLFLCKKMHIFIPRNLFEDGAVSKHILTTLGQIVFLEWTPLLHVLVNF